MHHNADCVVCEGNWCDNHQYTPQSQLIPDSQELENLFSIEEVDELKSPSVLKIVSRLRPKMKMKLLRFNWEQLGKETVNVH